MLTCHMLIGIPGSGKSTWFLNQKFDDNTILISSDFFIESYAKLYEKTYDQVFNDVKNLSIKKMNELLLDSINQSKNIVWDQTSLSVKSRRKKLKKIPNYYKKIAVVFTIPSADELKKRLSQRPGKTISPKLIQSMISRFEMPTVQEGFDEIIVINN